MKKTIAIPQGNEFSIFVPFVVFSGAGSSNADAALWNNVTTKVYRSNTTTEIEHTTALQEQYVVLSFADTLALGSYDVIISGEYETRNVSAPLNNLFAITRWADGNYAEFVVGQPIVCPTQTIIGQFNTTQDIEELERELRDALAAAEAAKAEYEEKVEELSDVAQQTTLTEGVAAIREDISHIDIDTTTIAKQGTNASATLTATQTAATNAYASAEAAKTATIDGNDTAVGVAKEVRGEVGTGSDTAAESGTLFAVVKWVKDKVKSIFNLIGSPASGQPATLFAAIAAGGGGGSADALETEVETGKELIAQAINQRNGTATSSMSLSQLANAISSTELIRSVAVNAINFDNANDNTLIDLSFISTYTGGSLSFSGVGVVEEIKNIPLCPNITSMTSMFSGCSSLKKIDFHKLANNTNTVACANMFTNCSSLESVSLSHLGNLHIITMNAIFQGCTSIDNIDLSVLNTSQVTSYTNIFSGSPQIKKVNAIGLNMSSLSSNTSAQNLFSATGVMLETLVGGKTYNEVVSGDIKTFVGLNRTLTSTRFTSATLLDQASLRAVINGLADMSGGTAQNFSMGATNMAKLSAEDIAVATNKNWTIS